MKHDICSVTVGGQRVFSFMSQALGLMADLDLGKLHHPVKIDSDAIAGTEHLRWMGDTRFIFGFIRGGMFIIKQIRRTFD